MHCGDEVQNIASPSFGEICDAFEQRMSDKTHKRWTLQTDQKEVAADLFKLHNTNTDGEAILISMPTGKGKTYLEFFYIFMKQALGCDYRALIVVDPIREQEVLSIADMLGYVTVGIGVKSNRDGTRKLAKAAGVGENLTCELSDQVEIMVVANTLLLRKNGDKAGHRRDATIKILEETETAVNASGTGAGIRFMDSILDSLKLYNGADIGPLDAPRAYLFLVALVLANASHVTYWALYVKLVTTIMSTTSEPSGIMLLPAIIKFAAVSPKGGKICGILCDEAFRRCDIVRLTNLVQPLGVPLITTSATEAERDYPNVAKSSPTQQLNTETNSTRPETVLYRAAEIQTNNTANTSLQEQMLAAFIGAIRCVSNASCTVTEVMGSMDLRYLADKVQMQLVQGDFGLPSSGSGEVSVMQFIDKWIIEIFDRKLGREWYGGGTFINDQTPAWDMIAVESLLQDPEALRYFKHVMSVLTNVTGNRMDKIGFSSHGLRLWFDFAKRVKGQYSGKLQKLLLKVFPWLFIDPDLPEAEIRQAEIREGPALLWVAIVVTLRAAAQSVYDKAVRHFGIRCEVAVTLGAIPETTTLQKLFIKLFKSLEDARLHECISDIESVGTMKQLRNWLRLITDPLQSIITTPDVPDHLCDTTDISMEQLLDGLRLIVNPLKSIGEQLDKAEDLCDVMDIEMSVTMRKMLDDLDRLQPVFIRAIEEAKHLSTRAIQAMQELTDWSESALFQEEMSNTWEEVAQMKNEMSQFCKLRATQLQTAEDLYQRFDDFEIQITPAFENKDPRQSPTAFLHGLVNPSFLHLIHRAADSRRGKIELVDGKMVHLKQPNRAIFIAAPPKNELVWGLPGNLTEYETKIEERMQKMVCNSPHSFNAVLYGSSTTNASNRATDYFMLNFKRMRCISEDTCGALSAIPDIGLKIIGHIMQAKAHDPTARPAITVSKTLKTMAKSIETIIATERESVEFVAMPNGAIRGTNALSGSTTLVIPQANKNPNVNSLLQWFGRLIRLITSQKKTAHSVHAEESDALSCLVLETSTPLCLYRKGGIADHAKYIKGSLWVSTFCHDGGLLRLAQALLHHPDANIGSSETQAILVGLAVGKTFLSVSGKEIPLSSNGIRELVELYKGCRQYQYGHSSYLTSSTIRSPEDVNKLFAKITKGRECVKSENAAVYRQLAKLRADHVQLATERKRKRAAEDATEEPAIGDATERKRKRAAEDAAEGKRKRAAEDATEDLASEIWKRCQSAEAAVQSAEAAVRSAEAAVRSAEAVVQSAEAAVRSPEAEVRSAEAIAQLSSTTQALSALEATRAEDNALILQREPYCSMIAKISKISNMVIDLSDKIQIDRKCEFCIREDQSYRPYGVDIRKGGKRPWATVNVLNVALAKAAEKTTERTIRCIN